MTGKEKQEIAEMQKEIEETKQDIEKMFKEMEGYEKIFADATQWLREKKLRKIRSLHINCRVMMK